MSPDPYRGPVDGEEFKAWCARLRLTYEKAGALLGRDRATIWIYRRAKKLDPMVTLACCELERRFKANLIPDLSA